MFCLPIISPDTEKVISKMEKAAPHADIFEIRLDLMESFDLKRIIDAAPRPLMITYRSEAEGGKGIAGPETVAGYLINGANAGADYVDVELSMPLSWRDKILGSIKKGMSVISTHVPDHTPSSEELLDIYRKSVETGADIVKIVTLARNWGDNLRMMELVQAARDDDALIIAFCMGEMGKISRIMSLLMGAYLGFSSIEAGEESASGQMPIGEMRKMLEYFRPC
ncbi:MAG: type I 3-dehydroquinate dehydratase [Deltaproteobacteria bacterium]|nr:type I 3-dehydroquinate dehydratase [Deltaproteobacteria bacterium]